MSKLFRFTRPHAGSGVALANTITAGVVVTKGASGIAPLYCFFDAETTVSTQTTLPWHEIRYYWDFGDGTAGTWGKGVAADSKNTDWGPMAGHIYETPGTYTPTCSMFDGVSITVWIGSPITVNSAVAPATWAGRKTILASSSGAFTCAGVTTGGTVTAPVASPGVVNWSAHGRSIGDPVYFSTTGALPTGLIAGTAYYIIAAGFGANAFEVSATFGGTAINFTGSTSGAHTAIGGAILKTATGIQAWDDIALLAQTSIDAAPAGPGRIMLRAGETFKSARTGNNQYIRSAGGPGMICTYNDSGPSPGSAATVQAAGDSQVCAISLASPGVISWTGHPFLALDGVCFTTTGTLPTGLALNTTYYVCAGATLLADSFTVATTGGNATAGTGVNTSGGSGVHTAIYAHPSAGTVSLGSTSAGFQGQSDWRIMDVTMDTTPMPDYLASYGFSLVGTCNNLLALRCPVIAATWLGWDFNFARLNGVPYTTRGFTIQDHIGIVDSPQQNPRTSASLVLDTWGYVNGKRLFIAGNDMNANGTAEASSHNFRSFHFEKIVIAHNTIAQAGTGRHHIKLHGSEVISWGGNPGAGTGAFTPSSTSNSGRGDFRRPWQPVVKGLWAADVAPQVWRCTTGGLTGGTEPSWNLTAGSTTTDGAAVWTECTAGFYAGTMIPTDDCSIRDTKFGNERFYSSEALITRNKFVGATTGWVIGVGPLDDDDYSLVYRVIAEKNQFVMTGTAVRAINFWGREQSFRNNLMDFTNAGASNAIEFVYAGHRNYPTVTNGYACRKLWVYDNSAYCSATATTVITFAALDPFAQDVVVKNNLMYCPGLGAKTLNMTTGTGKPGNDLVASNNTASITTSPSFGASPPVALVDWKPSGGYTLNAGAVVPVWDDFAGTTRPAGAAQDIGAFEQ